MVKFQVKCGSYNSPYIKDIDKAISHASKIKGTCEIRRFQDDYEISLEGIEYRLGVVVDKWEV